ncbi:hypothetical protein AB4424_23230 [Vibrio splendidus]
MEELETKELETAILRTMGDFTSVEQVPISREANRVIVRKDLEGRHSFSDGYMLGESLLFFTHKTPYWISEIQFVVYRPGADIKLNLVDVSGKTTTVLPSGRVTFPKGETIHFKVNNAASSISVVNGDAEPLRIYNFSISGRHIGALVKIMCAAQSEWQILHGEYEALRGIIAPDLARGRAEILGLKNESSEIKNELEHLKQAIAIDEKQAKTVSKYLKDIEAQHNSISEQVEQLLEEKTTLSSANRELKSEITDNKKLSIDTAEKLNQTKEELKKYKNDASLYSEDFSEYKEEINRQNSIYKTILWCVLALGTVISVNMYSGASKLSSDLQFNFDIWSLLVSRLPIISLNVFLLGLCSTVVYKMIDLITKNNERLSLTKQVAYLVKECTDSQSEDLTLNAEQILKNRISNKMVLIREVINSQRESDMKAEQVPNLDDRFKEIRDLLSKKSM